MTTINLPRTISQSAALRETAPNASFNEALGAWEMPEAEALAMRDYVAARLAETEAQLAKFKEAKAGYMRVNGLARTCDLLRQMKDALPSA